MIKRALALLFIAACSWANLHAADYYISTSGNDTTGNGSTGTPWRTTDKAFSEMSAGDTLIFKDGTYSTGGNLDDNIVSGTAGNYTIIKAENDGGAIITQTDGLSMPHTGLKSYVQVEGLKFTGLYQKEIHGYHLRFLRCAFKGGPTNSNTVGVGIGSNDYTPVTNDVLIEDCWFYGIGGRYNLMVFNSVNVIFRRVLGRHEGGWNDGASNPEAVFTIYNSSNVRVQNAFAIDSTSGTFYTFDAYAGIYVLHNDNANPDKVTANTAVRASGVIETYSNCYNFELPDSNGDNNIATDLLCVNPRGYGISWGSNNGTVFNLNRAGITRRLPIVAQQASQSGMGDFGDATSITVTNVIVSSMTGSDFNGVGPTYFDTFANGTNLGSGTGIQTYNPMANGWTYPVRIEAASNLKTAGSSSGQMGPEISKKWGTSGSMWGEAGYDTITADDLWPWPYEDRIKDDLCEDKAHGMCASTAPLTTYIFQKFGSTIPSDIYEADAPTGTPPSAISTVTVSTERMGIFAANTNLLDTEASWTADVSTITSIPLGLFGSNWDMWDQIEESSGVFTLTEMQSRLDLVRNAGMRVRYTYPYRPTWSPSVGCPVVNPFFGLVNLSTTHCAIADLGVYDRFVSTIALTYCEEIDIHEIPGNEPDFLFGSTNTEVAVRLTTHAIANIDARCPNAQITIGAIAHPLRTVLGGTLTAAATTYTDGHWASDYLTKLKLALPVGRSLSDFGYSFHAYYDADGGNATLQNQIASMTAILQNQGVTNPVFDITEMMLFGGSYTSSRTDEENEVGKSSFTYRAFALALSPNSLWPNTVIRTISYHNLKGFDFSVLNSTNGYRYSYFTLKKLATLDGYTAVGDQGSGDTRIFKFTNGSSTKYVAWKEAGTASFDPGGASTVTDVYGAETLESGSITLGPAPQFIEVEQTAVLTIQGSLSIGGNLNLGGSQ